jgi:hypothetical protein
MPFSSQDEESAKDSKRNSTRRIQGQENKGKTRAGGEESKNSTSTAGENGGDHHDGNGCSGDDNHKCITLGSYQINLENGKIPTLGTAVCAIVLLIAVGLGNVQGNLRAYGYTLSIVALIFSMLGLFPYECISKYSVYSNLFKFIWSYIGACIMTFGNGPFTVTSNGYFAAWGLVAFSAMPLDLSSFKISQHTIENIELQGLNAPLMGLGACAVVTIMACIPFFDDEDFNERIEAIFAIIVSALTIMIILASIVYKSISTTNTTPQEEEGDSQSLLVTVQQFEVPTFAILTLLWILSASMTTFRGPFETTGNGYFAGWCGSVLAVKVFMKAKSPC